MSITSEAKQEVVRLLALNKKIEAVKYIKETFQVSLLDAKNLVEAIEQELASGQISIDVNASPQSAQATTPTQLSDEARQKVEQLLQAGKKIEAVKFVNNTYKRGLKNALTWVEEVEQNIHPSLRSTAANRAPRNPGNIFVKIFSGVVLILVVIIAILYWSNQQIINQNIYIKGQVIALEKNGGDGFAPIVEYTWEGKTYTYTPTSRTNPSAYDVGETVGLYLDRNNPSEPLIDSFTDRWLGITIIGGIASFFAFFAFVIAKLLRRF